MLLLFISTLIYSTTLTLLFTPTPITLGALILILAFQLSLYIALISSTWFAFLLFLIYIGGLLVIFSYFIALSPNHPISLTQPISLFFITLFTSLLILSITLPILSPLAIYKPHFTSLLNLFTTKNLPLLLFLTLILFFALILVVKIRLRSSGPLRPFSPTK